MVIRVFIARGRYDSKDPNFFYTSNTKSQHSLKHSRQIAGIAAKEYTCVPYNRDRNRYRSKLKKKLRRSKTR